MRSRTARIVAATLLAAGVAAEHMAERAKATSATVLLANHSEFDNAVNKNRMLAGRGSGPHPCEIGADWVQRYFQVTEGCARAAQLGLEQKPAAATR